MRTACRDCQGEKDRNGSDPAGRDYNARMELHVFAPYHDPAVLARLPARPWLTPVLLGDLTGLPPAWRDNRLGEGRLFLSNLEHPPDAPWVGVLNARCPDKYPGFDWDAVPEAAAAAPAGSVVVPWPTRNGWSDDWLAYSEGVHPGLAGTLCRWFDLDPDDPAFHAPSLWGNDFVCRWAVWRRWRNFWVRTFFGLFARYGFAPPVAVAPRYAGRELALVMERVTTLFFAAGATAVHPLLRGPVHAR